jgi:hypothetical protein
MTKEMMMICLQVDMTKCGKHKMVSQRINGSHQITKLLEDSSQRMMIQMKKRELKMRMKMMTRKALSKMTMMMVATIISDVLSLKSSFVIMGKNFLYG